MFKKITKKLNLNIKFSFSFISILLGIVIAKIFPTIIDINYWWYIGVIIFAIFVSSIIED